MGQLAAGCCEAKFFLLAVKLLLSLVVAVVVAAVRWCDLCKAFGLSVSGWEGVLILEGQERTAGREGGCQMYGNMDVTRFTFTAYCHL